MTDFDSPLPTAPLQATSRRLGAARGTDLPGVLVAKNGKRRSLSRVSAGRRASVLPSEGRLPKLENSQRAPRGRRPRTFSGRSPTAAIHARRRHRLNDQRSAFQPHALNLASTSVIGKELQTAVSTESWRRAEPNVKVARNAVAYLKYATILLGGQIQRGCLVVLNHCFKLRRFI